MTQSTQRWYVVQSQPNSELKAVAHLHRQGFETYLPRYLKRRQHARRVELVARPLFPRYLFVGIDMGAQRWRSIYSTVGVWRLVCNGDVPTAAPPGVINALKQREDERGLIKLDQRPRFRTGDKIRVLDGPFDACSAFFEGLSDNERVMILLDLLGRKVRVVMDAQSIAAA